MRCLTRIKPAKTASVFSVSELHTARLLLRGLQASDFSAWSEVRSRCADWLTKWEPAPIPGGPNAERDPSAFAARCNARDRERQLGTGFAFSLWHDEIFCGEINVNNVVRGAFQSGHVGYWIDERWAGQGFVPEGLVAVMSYAFDRAGLHRLQISIIPRNKASLRVPQKLGIRCEGTAKGYLQIAGVWEDHDRFAITSEEWEQRRDELWALGNLSS